MQIDPAYNLILGLHEPVKRGQPNPSEKAAAPGVDSLDQTFKSHIEKALSSSPAAESIDIAQIRQELKDGLYDSPQMARAVAEKLLRLGI